MRSRLCLLSVLNAMFLLLTLGCGDEGGGGCASAPEKKEPQSAAPAGPSGGSGGSGSADLVTSDKKGRIPKPYQRAASGSEAAKSPTAAGGFKSKKPAIARITKRRVDGVVDRVEVACRIMAASSDGQCSSAANYAEIKERCCPDGLVERCTATMSGVVLVGRGCESAEH